MVIWFQAFLSYANNFQTALFDLTYPISVDLEVMAMNRYSALPKVPGLELYQWI